MNVRNHNSSPTLNKSWTSTRPSGALSPGVASFKPDSPCMKHSLGGSGSTNRFFTARSDSSPVRKYSSGTGAGASISSESISMTISAAIPTVVQPQKQQPPKSRTYVRSSFIYDKLNYDNCESTFDDIDDEDEIVPRSDASWETNVIILLPCRHTLKVPGSSASTIEDIRQLAWASAKMQGHRVASDRDAYFFKWANFDILLHHDAPLRELVEHVEVAGSVARSLSNIRLELVEKDATCRERLVDLGTSAIDGRPALWKAHLGEVARFHSRTRRLAALAPPQPTIENARLTPYPPPPTIPEFFVIKVHFRSQTKALRCTKNHTAASLMTIVAEKLKSADRTIDPLAWRFLVTGVYQYISPAVPLLSVQLVVERIKRTGEVDLTMVELSSLGLTSDVRASNIFARDPSLQGRPSPLLSAIFKPSKAKKTQPASNTISALEVTDHFCFRLLHAHEIDTAAIKISSSSSSDIMIYVEAGVYFGGELVGGAIATSTPLSFQDTVVWNEWLTIPIAITSIPKGARLCLSLLARHRDTIVALGWVGHRLYDALSIFNTSTPYSLLLWPGRANPIGTCVDNLQSKQQASILAFEFADYSANIHYPELIPSLLPSQSSLSIAQQQQLDSPAISPADKSALLSLLTTDPLYTLSPDERALFWRCRLFCKTVPLSLPKLMQAVDWTISDCVAEIFGLLRCWPLLQPTEALELLDPKFADCIEVRDYVVRCLDSITDHELELYMLQMVAALKHDVFHGSVLSLFLLGRVFQNTSVLAQPFFWHLRADIESQEVSERFRVLTAALLRYVPHLLDTFCEQIQTLKVLETLSRAVKDLPFEKRRAYLEEHLRDEKSLPSSLTIPFDASVKVLDIVPDKCRTMDSAKAPLWIVYKNRDSFAQHFQFIAKTGDDLRQDILTLQLLKLMDHMWKSAGLDLHMTIYKCIATGLGTGLIEVVGNSETAARIQSAAGGIAGAFKQTPISNWLKQHNMTENNYAKAVTKFTLSAAGYCVATYVLGIGDRHNDNIMVDKWGHLFHIDFGHFLGNFKTFAGIQREKAPFVLTPDFVYVIGKDSPNFAFFVETCCKAYNLLRKNSHIFFNMFELMLSTGIPELKSESDIMYLREKFRPDLTDEEASERFTKLIHESISTLTTQINFAVHILAHRKAIGLDRKSESIASI
eukprot:gene10881-12677_t